MGFNATIFCIVILIALNSLIPTYSNRATTLLAVVEAKPSDFLHVPSLTYQEPNNFPPPLQATSSYTAAPNPICQNIANGLISDRNASVFDAAISAALCTGLINSYASGLGGGSFMLSSDVIIDCRETAVALATPNMLVNASRWGGLAIGIPGELHCFNEAHTRFGRIPWYDIFEPIINLARDGFPIPRNLAKRIAVFKPFILNEPTLAEIYAPQGVLLVEGEICYRKKLAILLEAIAVYGISAFYTGPVADSLIATIQTAGGIMTLEDLSTYRAIVEKPLEQTYLDRFKVITPGEHFDISEPSPQTYHIITEAIKFAKAHHTILGDPKDDPSILEDVKRLISKSTGKDNAAKISLNTTFPPSHYGQFFAFTNNEGTCHISVMVTNISPSGKLSYESVAITTTINYPFGSLVVDPLTSIIFNNEMADFAVPEIPDELGLPPNPRNFPMPGRRPQSSMAPTIVEDMEKFHIISLGGSGGSRIYSSVLQSLVSVLHWGYSSALATGMPRLYVLLTAPIDSVEIEESFSSSIIQGLIARGHVMKSLGSDVIQSIVACVQSKRHGVFDSAVDWRLNETGIGQ